MASVAPKLNGTKKQRTEQILDFIRRVDPEADPTSIMLFRQVRKAESLLTRAAEKQLEEAGLSWPKLMLLMMLQANETFGSGGGLQPSELSEMQGIPRNNVSMLLAGLEEEGLISRELHGTDRRKFIIRLTPRGRKTLHSRLGTQFREIAKYFAPLTAGERATLLNLLTRLTQSLAEITS
ncbi:MAG: MarR family winged helix-turn-helix transcriptional regulator [Rudaea sp.]